MNSMQKFRIFSFDIIKDHWISEIVMIDPATIPFYLRLLERCGYVDSYEIAVGVEPYLGLDSFVHKGCSA